MKLSTQPDVKIVRQGSGPTKSDMIWQTAFRMPDGLMCQRIDVLINLCFKTDMSNLVYLVN